MPLDVHYLVGHSVDFDWEMAGKRASVKRIDTCAIARHLWPECDSHSLVALIYYTLGASPETREMVRHAHGAMADCRLTHRLLDQILRRKPEITTWSALWAYSEECRIPITMPMGRNRGEPITNLDTGEIEWYLDRDFIDVYLRTAFEREIKRRRVEPPQLVGDDELMEDDDDDDY